MHGIKYRSDIDGLRSVAVLPVIFFHLNFAIFSGGYVGVDVFFVISGFLITAAIRKEIEAREFSILGFYERRIRRIFPALFVMMAITTVIGFFLLMPDEFRDLGASLVGAATFASNIVFWKQSDYFAGPVDLKPLVHTWSLAVEEQYYVVLPLFLVLIARWRGPHWARPVLAVVLLSFAASVAGVFLAPSATYYMLHTRAWELLVGSLLALGVIPALRGRAAHEAAAGIGLAMIIGSAILLDSTSRFPGYNALWPCIGAALILHAGTGRHTAIGKLLGSRPFVYTGLLSYSLYLWHWPLIVYSKYWLLRDLTAGESWLLILATFACAYLSWRFVERPFRSRHRIGRRAILGGGVAAILVSGAIGGAIFALGGLPQRFPGMARVADAGATHASDPVCFLQHGFNEWQGGACFLTRGGGANVLLWGDSHANHFRYAIAGRKPPIKANVMLFASAGCPPVLGRDIASRPDCRANNDHVLDIIDRFHIKRVVLSAYWNRQIGNNGIGYDDLRATVAQLRARGLEVAIIGDNPDFAFANPQFLVYRLSQSDRPRAPFYMATRNDWSINPQLAAIAGSGKRDFFDPLASLCLDKRCLAYRDGKATMSDTAHFSNFGASYILEPMVPIFE